jgi:hypothetical protein
MRYVFLSFVCDKRIAIIPVKPYKTRNMTMENVVKCLVGLFAMFLAKSQMLKWASKGGGGDLEWRVKNG